MLPAFLVLGVMTALTRLPVPHSAWLELTPTMEAWHASPVPLVTTVPAMGQSVPSHVLPATLRQPQGRQPVISAAQVSSFTLDNVTC